MKKDLSTILNKCFSNITFISSSLIFFIVLGIFTCLFIESYGAIQEFGFWNFLTEKSWNYSKNIFGGFRPFVGTIITSVLALLLAIPLAIGIAIFISELCPKFLKSFFSSTMELLAAIPSIIYGMWGLFTFAPIVDKFIQQPITNLFSNVPVLNTLFKAQFAGGVGIFTASLVLSIMIVPYIASIARDTFAQTPQYLKESAYGMGSTKWEVIKNVILPYSKKGVTGGIIIAAGRAIGETMAVAYIIGNSYGPLKSIFDPYVTITSVIANEFNEASNLQLSSLFLLAFILFISNFAILLIAKIYVRRQVA